MSRTKPPVKIHAEHWDPDEYCFVRANYSLPAAQRVQLHISTFHETPTDSAENIAIGARAMSAAILELLASWSLRAGDVAYEEGVDRAKLEMTPENIEELPVKDLVFIFEQAVVVFKANMPNLADSRIITPDAEADGLTPENFRPADTVDGDIPGGSEVSKPLRLKDARRVG